MITKLLKHAILVVTVSMASAQNEGRSISARLVYFEQSPANPAEMYVNRNGEFVKCAATNSVSIEPVSCPVDASGKVTFTAAAAADQMLATASVPASVKQAVFFFLKNPTPGQGPPYQVMVVDEDFKVLPKGGSFVCNIAPKTTRISLGEAKYLLPPGKQVFVKRPEKMDGYNMAPLQMQIQAEGEEWKNLKDTMLRFSENERYFIVSYLDGRLPSIKIYKQVVQEKPAVPPT